MKLHEIVTGIGIIVLLIALPMPWLSVNLLGQYNLQLTDVYRGIFNSLNNSTSTNVPTSPSNLNGLISSAWLMLLAVIIYPITLVIALISLKYKKISIGAGVLGIMTSLLWIFGLDSLKNNLVQTLQDQGSNPFTQAITSALTSAITVGYGSYFPIIGGIIFIIAFLWKNNLITIGNTETKVTSGEPKANITIEKQVIPETPIQSINKTPEQIPTIIQSQNEEPSPSTIIDNKPPPKLEPSTKIDVHKLTDYRVIAGILLIGIVVGSGIGYIIFTPQIARLEDQSTLLKSEADKVPTLNQQLTTITNEKSTLQSQITTLQTQMSNLQSQINTITSDKSNLQSQLTSLQAQISVKDTQISDLNKQILDLKIQLSAVPTLKVEQLTNGGFEYGNLNGWTVQGANSAWTIYNPTNTYAFEGQYRIYTNPADHGTVTLSQSISLHTASFKIAFALLPHIGGSYPRVIKITAYDQNNNFISDSDGKRVELVYCLVGDVQTQGYKISLNLPLRDPNSDPWYNLERDFAVDYSSAGGNQIDWTTANHITFSVITGPGSGGTSWDAFSLIPY